MVSMQTTRSRAEHDERRRIWSPAFNSEVIRSYEESIGKYQDQLLKRLSNDIGNTATVNSSSETTAATLTYALYELAKAPHLIAQVRRELTALASSGKSLSNHNLQSLDLLNGVITETMRLYPPAGLLQRLTPPEGLVVGDIHVPGNTTVYCPLYVMARNEQVYHDAPTFRPERWSPSNSSKLVKEATAYAPFSIGPYNCVGKPLALMNLRTTLAKLITRFDFRFAEGQTGEAFEAGMRTNFTTYPGLLRMVFREVEREG
ncbi:MAG: hypothetical protein Q9222_002790 [Ikaeria aurantiellina]